VLFPRSVPRQAFDAAAARGKLLVSEATVAELDEVLRRPKFNKYLPEEKRLEFLAALVVRGGRGGHKGMPRRQGRQILGIGSQRCGDSHHQQRWGSARPSPVSRDCYPHAASDSRQFLKSGSLTKI
jgi:hypothetical protein